MPLNFLFDDGKFGNGSDLHYSKSCNLSAKKSVLSRACLRWKNKVRLTNLELKKKNNFDRFTNFKLQDLGFHIVVEGSRV